MSTLTVILAIIGGLIATYYVVRYFLLEVYADGPWILSTIMTLLMIPAALFFGGLCGGLIGTLPSFLVDHTDGKTECTRVHIVSIQDDTAINARFSLGSGYIDEELQYYFYRVVGDSYRSGHVSQDNTYIHETNDVMPSVLSCHRILRANWWHWDRLGHWRYDIYVPPGTIIKEFNLNARSS